MNPFVVDVAQCLRFYSRLPIPPLPHESDPYAPPDFSRMARVVPVAGFLIGCIGATALAFARGAGFGTLTAATFAVAALALATGAFHEDGLADTADSFGGSDAERRLTIMRDSRIGSYGAMALILCVLARISLVSELLGHGVALACAALAAAAACSRTAGLWLSVSLAPARSSGVAFVVGKPDEQSFRTGVMVAAAVAALTILPTAGIAALVMALAAAAAVAAAAARIAERHVGGYTGDFSGATQQVRAPNPG